MKQRPTPITAPERYPYMTIEVPDREVHQMRIPSHLAMANIIKELDGLHLAALMSIQGNQSPASITTVLRKHGAELIGFFGVLIGKAWHHQTQELEATNAGALLDYGEAVYEELHAEGYTFDQLAVMGLTIMTAVWEHTRFTEQVQQRAAFFAPLMEQKNSATSTAPSATSEAPGPSMN